MKAPTYERALLVAKCLNQGMRTVSEIAKANKVAPWWVHAALERLEEMSALRTIKSPRQVVAALFELARPFEDVEREIWLKRPGAAEAQLEMRWQRMELEVCWPPKICRLTALHDEPESEDEPA